MNQEITDKSRACCNCANATMSYPNCSCWQHKYCNGDRPYVIPKEAWIKTAEECEEFEFGTCQEADVYLELHRIMSEESKDKNPKPMKYIDADKLVTIIEERKAQQDQWINRYHDAINQGIFEELTEILSIIESLQQEPPETAMKSPFTGGKVAILSREEEVTFRGEKVKILRKYYRCEDTGREFTDSKLDDDMMWTVFRAYCEKKGMTSFNDIMLKQEQPEVNLENYISNKLRELGADLINHKPYSFNRGLNVGKTNAYNDILNRLNARKEE